MKNQTAIVLGGSIAGLLAARVLSDHFKEVVIIERDKLPDTSSARRGVPQAHHVHLLLKRGVDIVDQLFPNIFSVMEQDGAVSLDMTRELNMYHLGNWRIPFESGVTLYSASRNLLEHHIRRRVLQIPNITLLDECSVQEYLVNDNKTRIVGVRFQRRSQESGTEDAFAALIVDATGRGSRTPQWLESFGYPRVQESELKVDVRYVTRRFRIPEAAAPDWKMAAIYSQAPDKRIGAATKIEDDQYIFTLVGKLGETPPTEPDAFLEYAHQLPQPDFYNLLKVAQPIGDFTTFRTPSNLRHHYEKMASFPEGFAVTGAAVCSFNPTFAQGMTVAALEAMALDKVLRTHGLRDGLGRKIQKAIAKEVAVPWMMATSEDMRDPDIGVKLPLMTRFMNWYIKQVQNVTEYDRHAHRVFMDVMNMTSAPPRVFTPAILYRVLSHLLRKKGAPQRPTRITNPTPHSAG